MTIEIERAPDAFAEWDALATLLRDAFASMAQRIDPPSSVLRTTAQSLEARAREEALFIAMDDAELIGCVFATPRGDALYVSKLAVRPGHDRPTFVSMRLRLGDGRDPR